MRVKHVVKSQEDVFPSVTPVLDLEITLCQFNPKEYDMDFLDKSEISQLMVDKVQNDGWFYTMLPYGLIPLNYERTSYANRIRHINHRDSIKDNYIFSEQDYSYGHSWDVMINLVTSDRRLCSAVELLIQACEEAYSKPYDDEFCGILLDTDWIIIGEDDSCSTDHAISVMEILQYLSRFDLRCERGEFSIIM